MKNISTTNVSTVPRIPRVHLLPKGESIAPMPSLIPTMRPVLNRHDICGAFDFIVPTPETRLLVGGGLMPKGMRNQFRKYV